MGQSAANKTENEKNNNNNRESDNTHKEWAKECNQDIYILLLNNLINQSP